MTEAMSIDNFFSLVFRVFMMTVNNKSEKRNDHCGNCVGLLLLAKALFIYSCFIFILPV